MTIAEGLRSVARDLDADPRVLVFAWVEPRQGVTEDALVAAEQRLGATLPEGLRALYRAMNGFGLAWVDEEGFEALRSTLGLGNRPFKATRTIHRKRAKLPWTTMTKSAVFDLHADVARLDHRATGHVRVPPLAELVRDPTFAGFTKNVAAIEPPVEATFDGERVRLGELLRRFVVVDRFSASEQAFLYMGPGPRHLRVHRMANDFELDDADPHLDLEDYFSGVVATRGRRDGRRAMFSRDE